MLASSFPPPTATISPSLTQEGKPCTLPQTDCSREDKVRSLPLASLRAHSTTSMLSERVSLFSMICFWSLQWPHQCRWLQVQLAVLYKFSFICKEKKNIFSRGYTKRHTKGQDANKGSKQHRPQKTALEHSTNTSINVVTIFAGAMAFIVGFSFKAILEHSFNMVLLKNAG